LITFFAVALGSYLIGSIPSGYLAGRLAGIDIRATGSGNIGATNVTRALGKRYGYPVFLADFSKGIGAVLITKVISHYLFGSPNLTQLLQVLAGFFCVLGNAFPVWLHFRGGKGMATSAGVIFGLMPLPALVGVVVWVVTFATTRYVSLASIAASIAMPLLVIAMMYFRVITEPLLLYVSTGLAALVVLRHRSNISRLIHGTEDRVRRRED
jgi:acyl phosphate:glycerol-3-phosphate acyltransferase